VQPNSRAATPPTAVLLSVQARWLLTAGSCCARCLPRV